MMTCSPADAPRRWMQGDGPEADAVRNKKFKLIPRIVKGSWIVKQSVGTTPVLLGQKLATRYFRGPNYFEVCGPGRPPGWRGGAWQQGQGGAARGTNLGAGCMVGFAARAGGSSLRKLRRERLAGSSGWPAHAGPGLGECRVCWDEAGGSWGGVRAAGLRAVGIAGCNTLPRPAPRCGRCWSQHAAAPPPRRWTLTSPPTQWPTR